MDENLLNQKSKVRNFSSGLVYPKREVSPGRFEPPLSGPKPDVLSKLNYRPTVHLSETLNITLLLLNDLKGITVRNFPEPESLARTVLPHKINIRTYHIKYPWITSYCLTVTQKDNRS